MKYIIIFPINDEDCISWVEEYIRSCNDKSKLLFICTDNIYERCYGVDIENFQWQTQDYWIHFKSMLNENNLTESLCESLHRVADFLLYSGEPVKLFTFLPNTLHDNSSLGLYGALYRFKKWHNIQPIFITTSDSLSQSVLGLTEFIATHITDEMKYDKTDEDVIWMGKLSVTNKIDDKGYQFPGFRLSSEDIVTLNKRLSFHHNKCGLDEIQYGRMIEILDIVDTSTMPTFMLTSITLNLCLTTDIPESQLFLQDFNSNDPGVALIGRLATYHIKDIPTCGSSHLKTSSWKETIMNSISCVQESDEETLPGLHYLHFIMTANRDNIDSIQLKLTVLKSPRELNSNLLAILENSRNIYQHKEDNLYDPNIVSSLPSIDSLDLTLLHDHLNQIQVGLLKEWINDQERNDLPTDISHNNLSQFLQKSQELFINSVFDTYERTDRDPCSHLMPETEETADENYCDSTKWPERLALIHEESKQNTIKRFKSSDSMLLSSPFNPQESGTSLDAVEFLRFFQPDGSAVNDKMSPVRKKSTGSRMVRRISSHDSLVSWPESKHVNYHDIYYYSKKEDKEFSKVRDKFMKEETYCSVYSPSYGKHKNSNLIRSLSGQISSASRKSPRGTKRKQKFDDRPSSSIARPDSRTPTKLAQRQLKSPRKLASLPSRRSPRKNVKQSPRKSGCQPVRKLPAPFVYDEDSSFGNFSNTPAANTIQVRKKMIQESDNKANNTSKAQESRSQRHRRKLEEICSQLLDLNGINKDNPIFKSCSSNLYQVTKFFVKALPNAHSLSQEMKRIAEGQVLQVIDLEKRRQELGQKKKKVQ